MSTRFTVWCDTHEVAGPHIRRQHRRAILMQTESARFFPISLDEQADRDWGSFLIEHEYCDLRLKYEYNPNKSKPPEPPKPTHELMPDGSLREL